MNELDMHYEFMERIQFLIYVKLDNVTVNDSIIEDIKGHFRWLRNYTHRLDDSNVQDLLLIDLVEMCLWFFDKYFMEQPLTCNILLQFLTNWSINNRVAQQRIFQQFHSKLK